MTSGVDGRPIRTSSIVTKAAPAGRRMRAHVRPPVDAAPKPVLENESKADAEKAVAKLKEAGATADLK